MTSVQTRIPASRTAALEGRALPFGLSVIAGLVDVTTFLTLAGLFSAHITGNLAVLAADLGSGKPLALTAALAIPVFILVAAVVTAFVEQSTRDSADIVTRLLAAQCALVCVAAAIGMTAQTPAHPHAAAAVITGLVAVAAMAVQNTLLHLVLSRTPATTVMTGNVVVATVAATQLLMRRGDTNEDLWSTWHTHWTLVIGFLIGSFVAGLAYWWLDRTTWIVAVLVSLTVSIAWTTGAARRTD